MNQLESITGDNRLFTYKVAYDGGSAPNPYGGICTLAICKPRIRSVAKQGDVVVGFGCMNDARRIVYCMVVQDSLSWDKYINRCNSNGSDSIKGKIPTSNKHQGDCIWRDANNYVGARDSSSAHDGREDFERDVKNGKNVLIGEKFWYFGSPGKNSIFIPADNDLVRIIPRAQGHRSLLNSEMNFREKFVKFFNEQLIENKITKPGIWGTPSISPETADERTCSGCRIAEKESDLSEEELDKK
ncbi:MAG: hypothetical protein Q8L02_08105 [Candidatus Nitrotoga sp.]|nr:hypothetical protein [Candidatus Nitrotoga sp.]